MRLPKGAKSRAKQRGWMLMPIRDTMHGCCKEWSMLASCRNSEKFFMASMARRCFSMVSSETPRSLVTTNRHYAPGACCFLGRLKAFVGGRELSNAGQGASSTLVYVRAVFAFCCKRYCCRERERCRCPEERLHRGCEALLTAYVTKEHKTWQQPNGIIIALQSLM